MAGYVTERAVYAAVGGVVHRLPAAHTPVGQWVAGVIAAIDAGEIAPCRHCGRLSCECWDWVEMMTAPAPEADPHGELDRSVEIPF